MRRLTAVIGSVLLMAGLAPPAPSAAGGAPAPQGVQPVNVTITCNGEQMNVAMVPPPNEHVRVRKANGRVRWILEGGSDVPSMRLEPKPDSSWPLVGGPPTVAAGGNSGAIPVRESAATGTYYYSIFATCGGVEDELDPGMDIDP